MVNRQAHYFYSALALTAEQLGTISTAFQMGFGTFVDKPILPIALSDYRARNPE